MTINRKEDLKYHETLKQSVIFSYDNPNKKRLPEGCTFLFSRRNVDTGFYADVLKKGNNIIIVYRGSNELIKDWRENDLLMVQSLLPPQAIDALKLHDEVKRMYPKVEVTLTGHSLGGSLAQIVSAIRGTFAVTFNAYGVGDMFENRNHLKTWNIINYVNEYDPITMTNSENHLGECYALNIRKKRIPTTDHFIDLNTDLTVSTPIAAEKLQAEACIIHPRWVQAKDFVNKGQNAVRQKVLNTPHKASQCPGSYPVSGYWRDGVWIDGYIRKCGAKHIN